MPDFTPIPGVPCWVDLMSSDVDRSVAFYRELFGWTAEEPSAEFGGYLNFQRAGRRIAGCMPRMNDCGVPDAWSVYLTVEDATKTVEAAEAAGAQAIVAPMPVGDLGTMAILGDPTGAAIGVWQPGAHPGLGVIFEPGAPCWFELATRNYEQAIVFYRDVFGHATETVADSAAMRYSTLSVGGTQYAGIMNAAELLPPGVPSHWAIYFGVDDPDATLARAVELGGSVLQPAMDTPYGRMATAADATGAQFKIIRGNSEG